MKGQGHDEHEVDDGQSAIVDKVHEEVMQSCLILQLELVSGLQGRLRVALHAHDQISLDRGTRVDGKLRLQVSHLDEG